MSAGPAPLTKGAAHRGALLRDALRAAQEAADEALVPLEDTPGSSALVAVGPTTVAYLAWDAPSRRRLADEQASLHLLARSAVPVPAVLGRAPTGEWLLVRRVPADPPGGPAYVDAAVEAARRLATVVLPPARERTTAAEARRAPRRGRLLRGARALLGPVPVREFRRLRDAAAALPASVTVHGDYHPGNVLHDRAGGGVTVVDLELLARGPAGADLCQLWCGLGDAEDRARVLDALRHVPGADPGVLLPWTAVRTLADVTAALPRGRREDDLVRLALQTWEAARALPEARAW